MTSDSIHNCCLLNLCSRCTLHPHLLLVRLHSGNVWFIRISDMGRCYWLDSDFVGYCWSGCDYDRNDLCYGRIARRGRLNIYPLLSQQWPYWCLMWHSSFSGKAGNEQGSAIFRNFTSWHIQLNIGVPPCLNIELLFTICLRLKLILMN